MYRFLLTPTWLARLAAALVLATAMTLLGMWQLDRYEQRSAINARIDAAEAGTAVPLAEVVAAPAPGQPIGPAPPEEVGWSMVTATGRYDPGNEILIRGRTVSGRVGFEVLTPLVLDDGSAVLVDRGWVAGGAAGALAAPEVPPPPGGQVSVVGRVRPSESGPKPVERRDGVLQTRRIHAATLAPQLPYPLYDAYLLLESQQPPGEPGLTPIPVRPENSWLNAGYAAQWWLFAALVLVGFGWLAHRERARSGAEAATAAGPEPAAGPGAESGAGPRAESGAGPRAESGAESGPSSGAPR